ncbi:sulfotransferase family protein [Alloalcanivorax sp. C16-1]|uniref:sulfotransferase family protein n=1 Tax=Alloalcanivorax sp. C16-1 TaxID=3390051 RepID=UPI003970D1DE
MASTNHATILYIVAHGHSGTTLLDTLIGNMEGAVSTGEIERIARWASSDDVEQICTCGEDINDCSLWGPVCDRLRTREGREGESRLSFWSGYKTHLGNLGQRFYAGFLLPLLLLLGSLPLFRAARFNSHVADAWLATLRSWRVFQALEQQTGSRLIVDSSKSPLRMKALYMTQSVMGEGQSLRVVHLVRDGRAIVASYQRRLPRSVAHYAREWRRRLFYRLGMLLTIKAEHTLTLRYEDLATEPVATLKRLCEFVGLPEQCADQAMQSKDGKHNISGNPARLDREGITRVRFDERWREQLSSEDLAEFNRYAGRLNRRMGYR